MPASAAPLRIALPDLAATERLARALARRAHRRDVLALRGPLGAGKTAFARAFIRARPGGGSAGEVPSPTFTLVQVYDLPGVPVWHFDLYRLAAPEDAYELGIEEAFAAAISLVEWPERMGPLLPAARLDLEFHVAPGTAARTATLTAPDGWADRLAEIEGLDA